VGVDLFLLEKTGMSIYHLIVVVLAACELRWRAVWLRLPLVALAVLQLQFATGLGPAVRRAMAHPRRVVMPAPSAQPQRLATEFKSGVLVMADEAKRDLTDIYFPLGVLAWLALYPAVLTSISRRRRQPNDHQAAPA
jgi:hypothetical protein